MKKIILILAIALAVVTPVYFLTKSLKAEPIKDYSAVSPTVKIESYRLARNGDIYQVNSASATIISPDGLLLTNSHVVLDSQDKTYDVFAVCLTFNDAKEPACEYSAFVMAYDKNLDLALMKLANVNNRGGILPPLPYLDYHFAGEVSIGQTMDIYGYPDIGGKTLTKTSGQVSGFEDKNGVKYIKTDTDISAGNSGGTALNSEGALVGIPTYLQSSYENLGYVLDIKEAGLFIENNLPAKPQVNVQAYDLLKVNYNLLNDAKDTNHYEHPYYPRFSLTANQNWQWQEISKTAINLLNESNNGNKNIVIQIEPLPFKVPQIYLEEGIRQLGLVNEYLTGFKQEEKTFAGQPAIFISFNSSSKKIYGYLIPYGSSLVNVMYYVDLDQSEADLAEIDAVLNTFNFVDKPNDQPTTIETLAKSEPPFSIGRAGNWYIQRNLVPERENLIATYYNPNNVVGEISLSYQEIDDEEKELNNTESLAKLVQSHQWSENFKLIAKSDDIMVDNLSGWSLTYSYEGAESQEVRKVSEVYFRDGNYVYELAYDDLLNNYNRYLPDFKSILFTFKNYRQPENQIGKGAYNLGKFDYLFPDITYHRYEQAITDLADKQIVFGYTDGSFRPEKLVAATEVKAYINNSLAESKRADTNPAGADFLNGMEVTLADALKALALTYNLNIWVNDRGDAPLGKPYLDKGFEMDLMPSGLSEPDHPLTRGEFTYILYRLLENFQVI